MARSFNGTSDKAVASDSAALSFMESGEDFSIGGWMYCDFTDSGTLFVKTTGGGVREYALSVVDASTVYAVLDDNSAPGTIALSSPMPTSTWFHFMWRKYYNVDIDANIWQVFVNGVEVANYNYGAFAPAGSGDFYFASFPAASDYFKVDLAEWGVWDYKISDANIASLAAGAAVNAVGTPIIRWALTGDDSPELDSVASNHLTLTGTTKVDNPAGVPSAGGPATPTILQFLCRGLNDGLMRGL